MRKLLILKVLNARIQKFVQMAGYFGPRCKNAFNFTLKVHVTRYLYFILSPLFYSLLIYLSSLTIGKYNFNLTVILVSGRFINNERVNCWAILRLWSITTTPILLPSTSTLLWAPHQRTMWIWASVRLQPHCRPHPLPLFAISRQFPPGVTTMLPVRN